jgi:hypothetical protein
MSKSQAPIISSRGVEYVATSGRRFIVGQKYRNTEPLVRVTTARDYEFPANTLFRLFSVDPVPLRTNLYKFTFISMRHVDGNGECTITLEIMDEPCCSTLDVFVGG